MTDTTAPVSPIWLDQTRRELKEYLRAAWEDVDEASGEGVARHHPELVAAYLTALGLMAVEQQVINLTESIDGISGTLTEIAENGAQS